MPIWYSQIQKRPLGVVASSTSTGNGTFDTTGVAFLVLPTVTLDPKRRYMLYTNGIYHTVSWQDIVFVFLVGSQSAITVNSPELTSDMTRVWAAPADNSNEPTERSDRPRVLLDPGLSGAWNFGAVLKLVTASNGATYDTLWGASINTLLILEDVGPA